MKTMRRGYTIVEVMVLLGVLMTAFLGLLAASQYNAESFKELHTSQRASQYADEIRFALADPDVCTRNLGNLLMKDDGTPTDAATIHYYNSAGVRQSLIAQVEGDRVGAFIVEGMKLYPEGRAETDRMLGRFDLRLRRDKALGPDHIVRSFPIDIEMSANRITRCTTALDSSDFVSHTRCDITGGGRTYYDPVMNKCRPINPVVVVGGPLSVQCPAGMQIAIDGECWSQIPNGFTDPGAPSAVRTYENGVVQSGGPHAYFTRKDATTNSCSCVYSVEIDPSTWKCSMHCQRE